MLCLGIPLLEGDVPGRAVVLTGRKGLSVLTSPIILPANPNVQLLRRVFVSPFLRWAVVLRVGVGSGENRSPGLCWQAVQASPIWDLREAGSRAVGPGECSLIPAVLPLP